MMDPQDPSHELREDRTSFWTVAPPWRSAGAAGGITPGGASLPENR